jgi:hypothetical protein
MFNLSKMRDTLKASQIRVHIARNIPQFKNPSEECERRAVIRQASGNARLAFGKYVSREQMDARAERIFSAEI